MAALIQGIAQVESIMAAATTLPATAGITPEASGHPIAAGIIGIFGLEILMGGISSSPHATRRLESSTYGGVPIAHLLGEDFEYRVPEAQLKAAVEPV